MNNFKKAIPITILTGFLGAGKTTLLNYFFEVYPTKKFAIIENEIGSINIDNELIEYNKEGIFQLTNGCVCCSLNDDLKKTLNKLLLQVTEIDHILIETTGIADPSVVVSSILNDIHFQGVLYIDGVVALTDAKQFPKMLAKEPQVQKQLAFADAILINKIDLINDNELKIVEQNLNILNPLAQKEKTTFAQFKELDILNLEAYKIKSVEKQTQNAIVTEGNAVHEIESLAFTFEKAFDFQKLSNWLHFYLMMNAENSYRVKGILDCEGHDKKIVLQSVGTEYVMGKGSLWETQNRISKLVFIGKKLDKILLREGLKSCFS